MSQYSAFKGRQAEVVARHFDFHSDFIADMSVRPGRWKLCGLAGILYEELAIELGFDELELRWVTPNNGAVGDALGLFGKGAFCELVLMAHRLGGGAGGVEWGGLQLGSCIAGRDEYLT